MITLSPGNEILKKRNTRNYLVWHIGKDVCIQDCITGRYSAYTTYRNSKGLKAK